MNKKYFFTFVGLLVLLSASMPQLARAQHAGHGGMPQPTIAVPQEKTGTLQGRVVELGHGSMVVEGKYKGKVQQVTLMTDDNTKKEGAIAPGSEVKIKFLDGPMLHALTIKAEKKK